MSLIAEQDAIDLHVQVRIGVGIIFRNVPGPATTDSILQCNVYCQCPQSGFRVLVGLCPKREKEGKGTSERVMAVALQHLRRWRNVVEICLEQCRRKGKSPKGFGVVEVDRQLAGLVDNERS